LPIRCASSTERWLARFLAWGLGRARGLILAALFPLVLAFCGGTDERETVCEYGRALEKVSDGSKQYMIIALPAENKRGDEASLVSHRTVRDGFLADSEWIEYGTRYRSRRQTLVIRFPEGRPPTELTVRRQSDGRTRQADERTLTKEGARRVFRSSDAKPKVGEEYLIQWRW
jgi:hypothetical protein